MREAEVGLDREALRELGFDAVEGAATVDILDVTLLSCSGDESLAVTTFSDPVDELLTTVEAVEWHEPLDREDGSATYLCKTAVPDLPDEATPIGTDLTVQDVSPDGNGGLTLTLVGTQEALRSELAACSSAVPPVTLQRLGEFDGRSRGADRLTFRQREVLETAYELGYYEVPREAKAADIAERLDLDRSTVAEHLQRAERHLVAAALA